MDLRYNHVPKDLEENLRYRKRLGEQCCIDRPLREDLKQLCKHDFLFWLNTFCVTHDPRKVPAVIPFITYPFQDEALREMEAALGREDVCLVKSRDMGASWMVLALFTHRWQFYGDLMFGAVSREERLVDGSPKSLFAKVQLLLDRQPGFLLPDYEHVHLQFRNKSNGSTFTGSSTTGQVFRGDRYTAVLIDEFGAFPLDEGIKALASSQAATNCRFFNSTPQGTVGAFYQVAHNPSIKKVQLHWSKHPEKALGLYQDRRGKVRSPWYDRECERMGIPGLIAQELDLDFQGSSSPLFPDALLNRLLRETCQPAFLRGQLSFDRLKPNQPSFLEDEKGLLKLWMRLTESEGKPEPGEQYVIGIDVSMGSGASNSVASVVRKRDREKVAEFASSTLQIGEFAEYCAALGYFFNEAHLIWENMGPGAAFGKRLVDLGYQNLYYQRDERGRAQTLSKSMVPGWNCQKGSNGHLTVFQEYVRALNSGDFVNRSSDAINECRHYVYLPTGGVGNNQGHTDSTGARANHGDRPTADALANKLLGPEAELLERKVDLMVDPPEHSLAWRRMMAEREKQDTGWDNAPMHQWAETSMTGW